MWMSQLARNTPAGLRDVVWGKSSCINFAIASVIAERAVEHGPEHYKDSNSAKSSTVLIGLPVLLLRSSLI